MYVRYVISRSLAYHHDKMILLKTIAHPSQGRCALRVAAEQLLQTEAEPGHKPRIEGHTYTIYVTIKS